MKKVPKNNNFEQLNGNHSKPLSWYTRHFKHCSKNSVKGEFSPSYFGDDEAPTLIKKHFPDVKLILCLRNPIDRLYSGYWDRTKHSKVVKGSFEQAIKEGSVRIDQSFYYKHLTRYLKYFTMDQIMIVLFDDLVNHSEREIKRVLRFLKVDPDVKLDLTKITKNPAKESRFVSIAPIMDYFSNLLIDLNQANLLRLVRNMGIKRLLLKLSTTPLKYPEMKPDTRQYLRGVFGDDIKQLEKLLNRDLSHWK